MYKTDKEKANAYQKQLNRQNAYAKANFDHVSFVLPKGYKAEIKKRMAEKGFGSLTDYFKFLLKNDGIGCPDEPKSDDFQG